MALEYRDPCPDCGEQGRLRRYRPGCETDVYLCTATHCRVVEYTRDGVVHHETADCESKAEILRTREEM